MQIIFTTPKSFNPFSYLIRKIENRPYSHVVIKWYQRELDREVIFQSNLRGGIFQNGRSFFKKNDRLKTYSVAMNQLEMFRFKQWCIDMTDKKYDYSAILKAMVNKFMTFLGLPRFSFKSNGPKAMFCSELVAAAFQRELKELLENEAFDLVSPSDLDKALAYMAVKYPEKIKKN